METIKMSISQLAVSDSIISIGMHRRMVADSLGIQLYKSWSQEEKENLIQAIFNNEEIGAITVYNGELIDGRQVYYTVTDFYNGNATYRGKTYFELSEDEARKFAWYVVNVNIIDENEIDGKELFNSLNKN